MKNHYILNPTAGSTRKTAGLVSEIKEAAANAGAQYEIYFTQYGGDAIRYIKEVCEKEKEEIHRFFGAGGDGTLNEIINGCVGYDNAIAGIIPVGTGNDFIRVFGDKKYFMDIEAQLKGKPQKIDLISCEYEANGETVKCYCDNMINIGFDSNVVAKAAEIRKRKMVTGSAAYILGVIYILVKKKGADLRIELDDGYVFDGPLLLTAAANGRYCGGGVCSSPSSELDDGLMEVSVIKDMSRKKFISLYPSYSKGTHFYRKGADELIDYHHVRKAVIRTNGEPMKVSNDGEIIFTDEISLEVIPLAVSFSVPLME